MATLDKEKIQVFRDEIDGEKLAKVFQDIPEERVEKAFRNKDIQKLAEKLGEDVDLFAAVMGVYDTEKSYAAAAAAVPGNYTKEEFDEFRTVYANLFLKDFHEKVFSDEAEYRRITGNAKALARKNHAPEMTRETIRITLAEAAEKR